VALYGEKEKLLPFLKVSSTNVIEENKVGCYLTHCINKNKFFVPINYSTQTKLDWLAGYVDADGCINKSKRGNTSIQIVSVNLPFLREVQLMLTTLGVVTNIKFQRAAGE
jgi:ribonucleoside-diphosphate reductase alpha chain